MRSWMRCRPGKCPAVEAAARCRVVNGGMIPGWSVCTDTKEPGGLFVDDGAGGLWEAVSTGLGIRLWFKVEA